MMELVCPAGTPAALRAAVDAGAHTVYCGFADETNARNFPGLNFSRTELAEGVAYATARGAKVLVATLNALGARSVLRLASSASSRHSAARSIEVGAAWRGWSATPSAMPRTCAACHPCTAPPRSARR